MNLKHESVLLEESIKALAIKEDGVYVDCTLGGGGHSRHICERLSEKGILIGIDQDEYALNKSRKRLSAFACDIRLVKDNFRNIKSILEQEKIDKVDGILMDLGVSSFQLDDESRGFSYRNSARLDMRMDPQKEKDAHFVINHYTRKELAKVLKEYGEERFAWKIAGKIVDYRAKETIETTGELEQIVKESIPAKFRRTGGHPAKRTFQAIRIEVNDELGVLENTLDDAVDALQSKGRLAIITFHSLEDRIVKNRFKQWADPCTCPPEFPVCNCGKEPIVRLVSKKPILPTQEEQDANPRSKSAKLRIAEKI
ncbi:MAG TPA: 16S rRNA (cytosine(1402)-N(4))-methyltransferase [Eubacteriaceae bacterium]|nr:16S rRNA (cytosine(1402)-N(4))-methyltransferase [Eubacteriaceae bacterium]